VVSDPDSRRPTCRRRGGNNDPTPWTAPCWRQRLAAEQGESLYTPVAFDGTTPVGSAIGAVGTELRIPVPSPKLWSPESPFLYDLRVLLKSGTSTVDQLTSYFGMRSIGLKLVAGGLRPVLNGQFVFQVGTLDQGYWPDGVYTAPTDEALKFDIQKHKDLGFNLIRKHIKVEPQRWYYWATARRSPAATWASCRDSSA
jgi:hypothetical protein